MDTISDKSLSFNKRKVTSRQVGGIYLIPVDLLLDILLRLPVKDILRSRPVCKEWNFLSRTPKFISLHYNRSLHENNVQSSSFIYLRAVRKPFSMGDRTRSFLLTSLTLEEKTTTQLVAKVDKEEDFTTLLSLFLFPSCPTESDIDDLQLTCPFGGLICFGYKEHVIMYNPATRESQVLPSDHQLWNDRPLYCYYQRILGVWFESTMKLQYKVFRMVYWLNSNVISWSCKIKIYDSTVNNWRVSKIISGNSYPSSGLLLNGVVHFCMRKKNYRFVIVTFDARLETFGHFELPPCFLDSDCGLVLLPFRGNLACLKQNIKINDYNVKCDIWVMTEYGVEQSWTQKYTDYFVFPLCNGFYVNKYFRPLAFWRNRDDQDELLGKTYLGETFSFNLVTQKKTNLKLPCIYDLGVIQPYNVESLLPLNVQTFS